MSRFEGRWLATVAADPSKAVPSASRSSDPAAWQAWSIAFVASSAVASCPVEAFDAVVQHVKDIRAGKVIQTGPRPPSPPCTTIAALRRTASSLFALATR